MEANIKGKYILFICNPIKNKECSKSNCYINSGPCHKTKNPKYRLKEND